MSGIDTERASRIGLVGAEVLDPDGNPEGLETLSLPGSAAVVERLIVFRAAAYDWNCPQHITHVSRRRKVDRGSSRWIRTSSGPAVPTKNRTESDR